MACEIGDDVAVSRGHRSIGEGHRLEAYTTLIATGRGESRSRFSAFQPPEQQPLCVIKQHPMSATELDEDNIIAAVRGTRYQAPAAYLGVTRFHARKYGRSRHELICRLQKTSAT